MPTIAEIKERAVTETPLVLFECVFQNGSVERWSTHRVQVSDALYEARVLSHNLFEMRAGSEEAIDSIHRVAITLANADSYASQIATHGGWQGAQLTAIFVFYDLKQRQAVSEEMVLFRGIAGPPDEITESALRLTAANRLSVQRLFLPDIRIQRRCPWFFPSSEAQRAEAVDGGTRGRYSPFFRCGYSADQIDGRGNLDVAGQPFTTCNYTKSQCVERGMFNQDARGQATRRFGGIEYVPASTLVRGHGDSASQAGAVLDNQARYNDFVPLVYGTAWISPPVVTGKNDGNFTRMEILLGAGEINRVLQVVVDGIEIPAGVSGVNMTGTGWYNLVSAGQETGGFNLDFADANGLPLGDPYGSMAYLSVVVPNRVSDGKSAPKVSVLMEGSKLPTFDTDGNSLGAVFTANPAWVVLDLLRRSGWKAGELHLPSFARAAAYCDEVVAASDLYGNSVAIPRYACNLALRRRRSLADLIRGIRTSAGLYLTYGKSGLLELRLEERMSVQQSDKPEGSNAASALSGGWPAYEFGDGTDGTSGILRKDTGGSSVRLWHRSNAESPNRYTLEFQDQFNEYQQDSLSLVDMEDALSRGHEVTSALPALGVPNFHQAARLLKRQLQKSLRGNLYLQFETSVKAAGLRPGDLITITYLKEGLIRQPFRITRLSPGVNHSTALIEAHLHDDGWYVDSTEESSEVGRRQPVWGAGIPRPLLGSEIDEYGNSRFAIEEDHEEADDGALTVKLKVGFNEPSRPGIATASIPHLSLTAEIHTTGGALDGRQTLYYAISALDSNGIESPTSFVVPAAIPSGTNTNRVQLRQLRFSPGTQSFNVYRGESPMQLMRIAEGALLSDAFEDAGLAASATGPPDPNYDHAKFEWRLELHPEIAATTYSASTIGNATVQLMAGEYAGATVRVTHGKGAGQERRVVSHDATVLSIAPEWAVVPDATSKFVIAEGSWNFGATSRSSPVSFAVPNRGGATVHVLGVAVSASGAESVRELSPVTRWRIGGAAGGGDEDVSPAPIFGLAPTGRGAVEVVGVGFEDFANTATVTAGTLTLHYWDEVAGLPDARLAAAINEASTSIQVTGGELDVGDLLQIESEVVEVEEVDGSGAVVRRASHQSFATTHQENAFVFRLARKTFVVPFPKNFFGSPASGSFSYPILLPNARIAAAEMFVTNARGNGETRKVSFTATTDEGFRTFSGGQFTIQVDGYLAIQTGAAPAIIVAQTHPIRDIMAVVRDAPTGAPIELALRVNDKVLCALSIPQGETSSDRISGFGLPPLPTLARVTLDIVSVGFASGTTPGRDLTVTIRL